MTQPTQHEQMVLHPNPTWFIVGAVFFGVCGPLCLYGGHMIGWAAIIFSVVSIALWLWMAFSPHSRLRLSGQGFTFGTLKGVFTYRWNDIQCFFAERFVQSDRVVFAFAPHFRAERPVRRLPNDYGMSAKELVALLESWRIRNAQHGRSS